MYSLYYSPGSASMAVHQMVPEIGAVFSLRRVDFKTNAQHDSAYLQRNPSGKVPTLLVDGIPYGETVALLMLLAARHPVAGLAPTANARGYAEWLQWMIYLDNTLMATLRLWFYPRDLGADDHTPAQRAALQARIEAVWHRLNAHLSTQGPYLLGANFSCADILLSMLTRWSRAMPRRPDQWPALATYVAKLRARPSWQRLFELEGLRD